MRIISGEAKGRALFAPQGRETRPTSDKIRGAVFNILGARVVGARVLDLFGGSGALALEALSRGAASAVVADCATAAVRAIERNACAVLGEDAGTRLRVIRADYRAAIAKAGGTFDLVFLDPPYRMTDVYGDALERLASAGRLDRDCLIVMERQRQAECAVSERFERFDARPYGDTVVEFVRLRAAGAAAKWE